MPTVEWKALTPVEKVKRRPRFYSQMKVLKKNPGVWAQVLFYQNRFTATNAATTFRNNGFQAAVRKVPGGFKVYARYNPDSV